LYAAATGRLPFQGRDLTSTLIAVTTQEPPPPRALAPEVPPALSGLIMRLLAKEPDARPASARAVTEALGGTAPLPGSPAAPLSVSWLRQRWRSVLLVGCAAALLLGLGTLGWLLRPVAVVVPSQNAAGLPLKGAIDVLLYEKGNPRRQDIRL